MPGLLDSLLEAGKEVAGQQLERMVQEVGQEGEALTPPHLPLSLSYLTPPSPLQCWTLRWTACWRPAGRPFRWQPVLTRPGGALQLGKHTCKFVFAVLDEKPNND